MLTLLRVLVGFGAIAVLFILAAGAAGVLVWLHSLFGGSFHA